jgi:stringent starvation protein B
VSGDDDNEGNGAGKVVRVDFAAKKQKPPQPKLEAPPAASTLTPDRPEKLRVFARLVERGMVMVTLDARKDNARVPPKLAGELQLNLNFSHRFGRDDFFYDDDGVRSSLMFGGQPFFVDVPWTAVYSLSSHVDGERCMWPESFPEELRRLVPPQVRHGVRDDDDDEPPPTTPPRPTLRRVK